MILPGTLVQYIGSHAMLRKFGIYTVETERRRPSICRSICPRCDDPQCGVVLLCDGPNEPTGEIHNFAGKDFRWSVPGWSTCLFRILAGPITEADRLECSAPSDGGAKQPTTPSPKIKVPGIIP
jgi:hypothetical protein